ncbi:MAG: hypothetical protein E7401_01275 [Ruminococcaceae bacterium]|nr:hypothetical protein [Oscillospiraceae bacterium]
MYQYEYEILLSTKANKEKWIEAIKYDTYTIDELACEYAEELIDEIKSVLNNENLRADCKAYEILMLVTFGRGI